MDYTRQRDFLDPEEQLLWPVHLIGLGGIGSAVARQLVMLGIPELHLYDDDVVSAENPANQHFWPDQVGQRKAAALATELARYGTAKVVPHERRVTADDRFAGIVISGVDSMASRYAIWDTIRPDPTSGQVNLDVVLYLDGRLGGRECQLLTIRPARYDDVELYEKYLFPDSNAKPLPCTAKAIVYPATQLAAWILARINNWVRDEAYPINARMNLATHEYTIGRWSA